MGVRIGIGMGLGGFPFETIREFRTWLDVCEDSAIDSIWQSDRVVSREPAFEPMTLLSVIAGATERLKFGTNAVVLPFRDPVTFARQCATLDTLSDGRFLPAVGIGRGDAPEWEATGRSPKRRGKRADEALEVMTRLWSSESVDFEGEFFSLKNATINPRPKQQPLPLWLGGSSDAAVRRTARYASGWVAPLQGPEEAAVTVEAIRKESQRIGKPIPEDHYGATILFRIGVRAGAEKPGTESGKGTQQAEAGQSGSTFEAIQKNPRLQQYQSMIEKVQAVGDAETVLERVRDFGRSGVTKFIAIPLARDATEMVEQSRLLSEEVIPFAND